MYRLDTSTGFHAEASTVEQIASALAQQMRIEQTQPAVNWVVETPHGTVLTAGDLQSSVLGGHADPDTRIDRAYALLVRDHLTQGRRYDNTGLFLTTR